MKDTVVWEVERGLKLSAADIAHAQTLHSRAWDQMRIFMEKYEYFVAPSTQVPPFDVTQPYVMEVDGVRMQNYTEWMKCCWLISILENPAISMPSGYTPEGLPVGLQIVGRHRDEWSVLQMAMRLSKRRGRGIGGRGFYKECGTDQNGPRRHTGCGLVQVTSCCWQAKGIASRYKLFGGGSVPG